MLGNCSTLSDCTATRPARAVGQRLSDWTTINFFDDESLVEDPYPYFDELRGQCPVLALSHHGVVAVTGYVEATDV